jgi:hypothetical protein
MPGSKERVKTQRIIDCLRETNGLISLAAKRVPCSVTTIYKRARDVARVQQVIDECRGELVDLGELALRRAVVNGEPWAVALVLKTLGKGRGYVERQEVQQDGVTVLRVVYGDGDAGTDGTAP